LGAISSIDAYHARLALVVFAVYGHMRAFRKIVIESPGVQNYLRRGFAMAFAGLGAKLAFTDR
jgi:threonine/homoserine/homoserine lactone efflux protein